MGSAEVREAHQPHQLELVLPRGCFIEHGQVEHTPAGLIFTGFWRLHRDAQGRLGRTARRLRRGLWDALSTAGAEPIEAYTVDHGTIL